MHFLGVFFSNGYEKTDWWKQPDPFSRCLCSLHHTEPERKTKALIWRTEDVLFMWHSQIHMESSARVLEAAEMQLLLYLITWKWFKLSHKACLKMLNYYDVTLRVLSDCRQGQCCLRVTPKLPSQNTHSQRVWCSSLPLSLEMLENRETHIQISFPKATRTGSTYSGL